MHVFNKMKEKKNFNSNLKNASNSRKGRLNGLINRKQSKRVTLNPLNNICK